MMVEADQHMALASTFEGVFEQRKLLGGEMAGHRTGVPDYSNKLWTVLVLNLWHKRWIEGSRPRPEVRAGAAPTASA